MIGRTLERIGGFARERSRVVTGGIMALGAVIVGTILRRRRPARLSLPDPAAIASETALSVANAAKGTVIVAVREADRPDVVLLRDTVKEAMRQGVAAGADLAAVATGAVDGATEVARLLDRRPAEAAEEAARAAMEVAGIQGSVASARIQDLLAPHGLLS